MGEKKGKKKKEIGSKKEGSILILFPYFIFIGPYDRQISPLKTGKNIKKNPREGRRLFLSVIPLFNDFRVLF